MKRLVSICLFVVILLSCVALANTENGIITIGNSGMVVLLPSGTKKLKTSSNELVAARTPNYTAPNGIDLIVTNYGCSSSEELLERFIQVWDPEDSSQAVVDMTFASYENENAFHDWIQTWNSDTSSQYLEVGQQETHGRRIPYFICLDTLKGPETLQGMIVAFVADKEATYAFRLTRLFTASTDLTPKELIISFEEYLTELRNSIGTILCDFEVIPADWSYQEYNERLTHRIASDGITGRPRLLLDAYNEILDAIYSQEAGGKIGFGEEFYFLPEYAQSLIKPIIYTCYEDRYVNIEQILDSFLEKLMDTESWLEERENYEKESLFTDKTLFEEDDREIVIDPFYKYEEWPCDALLFTLRDENEELLEKEIIYILARVYLNNNKMVVWLVTDQTVVEEYLNLAGRSKNELLGIAQQTPSIPNAASDLVDQIHAESEQNFILEEHKGIADTLQTDGYIIHTNGEYQLYYSTQKNDKLLQPMIINLSDERAAIRGTEVIVEDLQTMLDVAVQYEADGEISPIAPELIEHIQKEGYVIDPLCYYGGDIELIVFYINSAANSERMDDQLYAATRLPDENGNIQLGLITDEQKIEQGVKEFLSQNAAGFEVLLSSNGQASVEHIHIYAPAEIVDQKYVKTCSLCGYQEIEKVFVNTKNSPEEQVKEAERQLAYLQFEHTNDYFWNEYAKKVTTSINDDTWVEYINTAWSTLNHFGDESVEGFNYGVEYAYGVLTGEQSLTLEEIIAKGGPGAALVKEIYQSNKNDIYVLEWEKLLIDTLRGYDVVALEYYGNTDPDQKEGFAEGVIDIADELVSNKADASKEHYELVRQLFYNLVVKAKQDGAESAINESTLNWFAIETAKTGKNADFWKNGSRVLDAIGGVLTLISEEEQLDEHMKELDELAKLLVDYEKNLDILFQISNSTNNPELKKACANIEKDMTELLSDPSNYMNRDKGLYAAENISGLLFDTLKAFSPIALVTIPDAFGQWDAVHISGLQLQTLSIMDASIKDEAYEAATNNDPNDYYLTELYRVLQLEGLNQSKDYINKFDDAWGMNASDLGIGNVESYINVIDNQIIRNVEFQNNLLHEYIYTQNQEN